ncbi:hypothetical protein TNCV_4413761 [Trichonephila clavipes]|uniref:Uncharacterized protein n=1 Tax=Trichonephila clavipes TaxID=2585209 RepID=A0A8X6S3T9_TRICX|nr:hypothetical protein TNCV_4413761 [Trichonephila clavipes]
MEVKTQFGNVMRLIQKLYPLETTTVDSLSSTERGGTFILTAVLDSSTTSNPKVGRTPDFIKSDRSIRKELI